MSHTVKPRNTDIRYNAPGAVADDWLTDTVKPRDINAEGLKGQHVGSDNVERHFVNAAVTDDWLSDTVKSRAVRGIVPTVVADDWLPDSVFKPRDIHADAGLLKPRHHTARAKADDYLSDIVKSRDIKAEVVKERDFRSDTVERSFTNAVVNDDWLSDKGCQIQGRSRYCTYCSS